MIAISRMPPCLDAAVGAIAHPVLMYDGHFVGSGGNFIGPVIVAGYEGHRVGLLILHGHQSCWDPWQ